MRLDTLLVKKGLVKSRNVAESLIKNSKVSVNGKIITKPAKDLVDSTELKIEILEQPKYVGRGGLKLEKALLEFKINPEDLVVLDVGSSTGGFTDCLLQQGAKKIYAIDVGTGQFDSKLKTDARVILMEKTDIRDVKNLPEKAELAVVDVSFISLELILPAVKKLLKEGGKIIALVKPQFETPKIAKNKNGVVKSDDLRNTALDKVKDFALKFGLKTLDFIDSPISGGSGNKEYLLLLQNIV